MNFDELFKWAFNQGALTVLIMVIGWFYRRDMQKQIDGAAQIALLASSESTKRGELIESTNKALHAQAISAHEQASAMREQASATERLNETMNDIKSRIRPTPAA